MFLQIIVLLGQYRNSLWMNRAQDALLPIQSFRRLVFSYCAVRGSKLYNMAVPIN